MVFLDIKKQAWVIKDLEIPVIEDIPMIDLQWFRTKSKESLEAQEAGSITQLDGIKIDEEWWDKICEIGLDCKKEKIINTGLTEPKFRELMAEIYAFLSVFGNVEEATLSPLYIPLTQKKEKKQ